MSKRPANLPWNYLHDASASSLESYELSRLNHAANLRRELTALLDQWIEDSAQALLARWVREDRALPHRSSDESPQSELPFNELPPHAESSAEAKQPTPRGPMKLVRPQRRMVSG
jgi:hypothetical protein